MGCNPTQRTGVSEDGRRTPDSGSGNSYVPRSVATEDGNRHARVVGIAPSAMFGLDDGQLDTAFDDARRDGVTGKARRVVDVELLHEMVPMLLDGLDADAKLRRDLLVGLAFGNQLEHLHLTRTQANGLRL